MKKNIRQRLVIIAIVTLASLYYVIGPHGRWPRPSDFTLQGIKNTLEDNIHLGLDLKGGSHLVMRVKVEDYMRDLTGNIASGLAGAAKAAGYDVEVRPEVSGNSHRIVLVAKDPSKINEIREQLPRKINDFNPNYWSASVSGNTITWELGRAAQSAIGEEAVQQSLRIIDTRINALGVVEPTFQEHGAKGMHQILLQMPGIQDPERVKRLLVAESRLDLMKVISQPYPAPMQTYDSEEDAKKAAGTAQNRKVLPYSERDEPTAQGDKQNQEQDQNKLKKWVVVETPPVVSGSELRSAEAASATGREEDYEIDFTLKPSGADKFGRWTAANVNQYMAIVLNDVVQSAPFIKSAISDQGQITGNYTKKSAEDLALTLRSGALPAKLEYQEERTVGPSLGADSIRAGVTASLAGLALVVLFMVFYYRGAGVNAVVALILNLILTVAALILFEATLTLPGIAGLILTIGMAVDSNVLIFERIREEWRSGKTVPSAVDQGFDRAFVTIIDTHVTTIVAALFLFVFGTGPIRGFAVTLVLGLLANLFSAVYVSRTIFMWLLARKKGRVQTLSI